MLGHMTYLVRSLHPPAHTLVLSQQLVREVQLDSARPCFRPPAWTTTTLLRSRTPPPGPPNRSSTHPVYHPRPRPPSIPRPCPRVRRGPCLQAPAATAVCLDTHGQQHRPPTARPLLPRVVPLPACCCRQVVPSPLSPVARRSQQPPRLPQPLVVAPLSLLHPTCLVQRQRS